MLLRDFSILHGGHFGILASGVDNLTIDNLKIDTNRDGVDVDCCRNVRISNCSVNSPWDDGICLKSSFALGYALYGFTPPSCKLQLRCRRLRLHETEEVFTVAPAFVMPYMSGRAADVEKALFLMRFHVPCWAIASVFGRDAMY